MGCYAAEYLSSSLHMLELKVRVVFILTVYVEQFDLMEFIPLQVKPQLLSTNLKAQTVDTWLLIPLREHSNPADDLIPAPPPKKTGDAMLSPHSCIDIYGAVYPIVLIGPTRSFICTLTCF